MSLFRNLLIERKRKPYYCEVEYLQGNGTGSNGTTYIDTGIYVTDSMAKSADITFEVVSSGSNIVYASGDASNNSSFLLAQAGANNHIVVDIENYSQFRVDTGIIGYTSGKHRMTIDSNGVIKIDGTSVGTSGGTITGTPTYTLKLFANKDASSKYNAKIYHFKLGNVIDLIPVLDWNYTPCMYDKVSRKLFYNQGTGTFSYGREIHYVEYLESTGTQYINTGVNISNTLKWELEASFNTPTGSSGYLHGATRVDGSNQQRCMIGVNSANYYSMSFVENNTTTIQNDNQKHLFEIDALNKTYSIDGEQKGVFSNNFTLATLPIYLFGRNANGAIDSPVYGKVYGSRIYSNNTLVRDYYPAIDENGVGFMFDRVTHTIFDNARTGAFKYPAREIEYLENTSTQYINTRVNPTNTTGLEIKHTICQNNGLNNILVGARQDSGNTRYWINLDWAASVSKRIEWGFGNYTEAAGGDNYILNSSNVGKVITTSLNYMNDRLGKADGIDYSKGLISSTTLSSISRPIFLFCANNQGTANYFTAARVYYFKITQGSDVVRDYVPVFKDGSAGLLDKINDVFYAGSGSGTFGVGKIVERRWF